MTSTIINDKPSIKKSYPAGTLMELTAGESSNKYYLITTQKIESNSDSFAGVVIAKESSAVRQIGEYSEYWITKLFAPVTLPITIKYEN